VEPLIVKPSEVRSKPPQVTFKTDIVSPPASIYIGGEDRLFLNWRANSINGIINFYLRILKADGTIAVVNGQQPVQFAYTGVSIQIPSTEGFLLSATAEANLFGTNICAAVSISITRVGFLPFDNIAVILRGLLVAGRTLTFPYSIQHSALEGPGLLRTIVGTNPAAGLEINETVPANAHWRLISMRAILTADATVINRLCRCIVDDGANIYYESDVNEVHAASLIFTYIFTAGNTISTALAQTVMLPLPNNLILGPGHRIRSGTTNLQAGDDWAAPIYLVEEWIEDPV
jgi:hypothetical protein